MLAAATRRLPGAVRGSIALFACQSSVGVRWHSVAEAVEQAKAWDPNPTTRAAVSELPPEELEWRFGSRLQFGTAGIRGPMGPGTACMNDLTVLQASQGLAAYVLDTVGEAEARDRGVVIGYDHRGSGSLSSARFARLAAQAMVLKGIRVFTYDRLVATPMVAFGVKHLGAAAGVMVTASHNPAADNGYKVYWGTGAQITPPHDSGIAACIASNLQPWDEAAYATAADASSPLGVAGADGLVTDVTTEVLDTYFTQLARVCRHKDANATAAPVVYTAMHGVGTPFVRRAFDTFGLPPPIEVVEQVEADPTFPTVAFPNPEEGKGALAMAMATADSAGAAVVLASDPDADRLAVAVKQDGDADWRVLTGNEIGALLAHWQWTCFRAAHPDVPPSDVYMLASTVSSKFIGAMAAAEGFNFEETLTGFKWMGKRSAELRAAGKTVLMAYEAEIGFCVGDAVLDKDGVTAAAVFAEMTAALQRGGATASQHLDALSQRYGYFVSNNGYLMVDDPAKNTAIFTRLRNDGHYWHAVGGKYSVASVRDLGGTGFDSSTADMRPSLPVDAANLMITYTFSNGCVATLRTSGTEPKLKYYTELSGSDPEATAAELDDMVAVLIDDMVQPDVHGITRPLVE